MVAKLCIGPMSKNVVDAALNLVRERGLETAFIPSRRQVEFNGGYVNNWTTAELVDYTFGEIPVHRDHAGPAQGAESYIRSLKEDCVAGVKQIHIDPWKFYTDHQEAAVATAMMIELCLEENPNCRFEVGTEEQIRKYSGTELFEFLERLESLLGTEKFRTINYAVVQSGTIVRAIGNTGKFNSGASKDMAEVCHRFGLLAKEHNSDYLSISDFQDRAACGVDTFNIAPELGVIETRVVLELLKGEARDNFIKLCKDSGKWKKWVDGETSDEKIAKISGHYQFAKPEFKKIKESLPEDFDLIVRERVSDRIMEIVDCLS